MILKSDQQADGTIVHSRIPAEELLDQGIRPNTIRLSTGALPVILQGNGWIKGGFFTLIFTQMLTQGDFIAILINALT